MSLSVSPQIFQQYTYDSNGQLTHLCGHPAKAIPVPLALFPKIAGYILCSAIGFREVEENKGKYILCFKDKNRFYEILNPISHMQLREIQLASQEQGLAGSLPQMPPPQLHQVHRNAQGEVISIAGLPVPPVLSATRKERVCLVSSEIALYKVIGADMYYQLGAYNSRGQEVFSEYLPQNRLSQFIKPDSWCI